MALTFGQMTAQILQETYRDVSFTGQVENAIVSAIKELETEELFLNQKFVQLTVPELSNSVPLPEDFISVLVMTLLDNNGVVIYSAANGFKETTMYELITYNNQLAGTNNSCGLPGYWALYENNINITASVPTVEMVAICCHMVLIYVVPDVIDTNVSGCIWHAVS